VLIGLAFLAAMATCSEDMSAEQTQKVQQPEFAHQSIKRESVEDYGAEQSSAPSAIAAGEAYTHTPRRSCRSIRTGRSWRRIICPGRPRL